MTAQPKSRDFILPASLPPRGLSREQAAAYIGVSPSFFDQMISDGMMPKPKRIRSRTIWDRHELDLAFSALPGDNDEAKVSFWDQVR
jgi:predicted DNA-binding transcriptional regulator AlpA